MSLEQLKFSGQKTTVKRSLPSSQSCCKKTKSEDFTPCGAKNKKHDFSWDHFPQIRTVSKVTTEQIEEQANKLGDENLVKVCLS